MIADFYTIVKCAKHIFALKKCTFITDVDNRTQTNERHVLEKTVYTELSKSYKLIIACVVWVYYFQNEYGRNGKKTYLHHEV